MDKWRESAGILTRNCGGGWSMGARATPWTPQRGMERDPGTDIDVRQVLYPFLIVALTGENQASKSDFITYYFSRRISQVSVKHMVCACGRVGRGVRL